MNIFKHISGRLFAGFMLVGSLLSFFACSSGDDEQAEHFNDLAYWYHYRSLDSVKVYAEKALNNTPISSSQHAEALNNLAFYYIGKMRYATADSLLKEAYSSTDNNIELFIACIQQMRLCQRQSRNKDFYDYRQRALQHRRRILEEQDIDCNHVTSTLSQHQLQRMHYAESEFLLVTSVYDYYVGKADDAIAALHEIDSLSYLRQDTVQYVAYLYDIGSGGILTHGTKEDITHQELEYLMQCYVISYECGYAYWRANALQALSEHLLENGGLQIPDNQLAKRYLNTENVPDSLLAGNLAQQSLDIFREYGDVYQQAAAWRTLARCYGKINDFPGAVYSLQQAEKDTLVRQSPSLMASLYEEFSIAFSALNQKQESDKYRNKYLDLYEDTRQDRQLEARAEQLDRQLQWLSVLIYIIIGVLVVLILVLAYLVYNLYRKRKLGKSVRSKALDKFAEEASRRQKELEEEQEELEEQCGMTDMELSRQQETYAEDRAKMHLISSILPLLDRMLHETSLLAHKEEPDSIRTERKEYVSELIDTINEQNAFLTRWIQLKQGELSLRIESFALQSIFDVLAKGASSFTREGITLDIQPSDLWVKADRTLTLFMLNTLCDNARKNTSEGETVTIKAERVGEEMVELSISDTGKGMTSEQVANLFVAKPITDEKLTTTTHHPSPTTQGSHGFGLLNCKGIIEKYKKTNALFTQCSIGAESEVGKGSRFFFRLPIGIKKMMLIAVLLVMSLSNNAAVKSVAMDDVNYNAISALADSVYKCNIDGRYGDAVTFGRQCLSRINASYLINISNSRDTLMLIDPMTSIPAEVRWMRDSIHAPYDIIISVRNEMAVAALALHEWQLYHYNNSAYSQLFKERSVDNSFADYCKQMAATEVNRNVAIILLILLILAFIPIYYFAYYRHVISDVRRSIKDMKEDIAEREHNNELLRTRLERLQFERDRLHVTNNVMSNSFSAIKHETMYYPSRIQQLLCQDTPDYEDVDEVAQYYRSVYDILANQALYNCRQQLPQNVLRDMMLRLMARLSAQRKADIKPEKNDAPYEIYHLTIVKPDDTSVLVLTQIVRDLGETYNLRRSGIVRNDNDLVITVPA